MTNFTYISDSFLLETPLAQQLYFDYAMKQPIIDFHTHLEACDIYHDRNYTSLAEAWLSGDHYLWRAMRSVGIDEHFITGAASDYEKFTKWCEAMPFLIGSPLHHWCHLELKRFFKLDLLLCPEHCERIWQHCNQVLATGKLSARQILLENQVKVLCTTDDPLSDLTYHQKLANEDFPVKILPTFRADSLVNLDNIKKFKQVLNQLSSQRQKPIDNWQDFKQAVIKRIDYFHEQGCRLSDVGLPLLDVISNDTDPKMLFAKLLQKESFSSQEKQQLSASIFYFLAQAYHSKGWSMQLHLGVMANVNQRRLQEVGAGTGFSVMHDQPIMQALAQRLSYLDAQQQLPQTVIYNLNPKDTWPLGSLIGAFQDSTTSSSKIQLGAAWWFNDHKHGMIQHLTALANLGSLGKFIGMLTDSRSLFSVSRHDYFRRVLCHLLAKWALSGEIPNDQPLLQQTIENMCYRNAKEYFNFGRSNAR